MTRTAKFRHAYPVAALLVAALAAGCGSAEPEEPTSQPTMPAAPTTTSAREADMQPPGVPVPLDASAFVDAPCESLARAQYADLKLEQGKLDANFPGARCTWRDGEAEAAASVHYHSDSSEGLDDLYEQQEQSDYYPRWEPTEVNGYPAVLLGDGLLTDEVSCSVAVGLSDSLYFTAIFRDGYVDEVGDEKYEENCAVARNVASMVVDNVKSAG